MNGTSKNLGSGLKKRTILIVDDDQEALTELKQNLVEERFNVQVAQDGEVAIELVGQQRPDLILLDINIPKVSGLDICKAIRADKANSDIPIIFLSGRLFDMDRVYGLELGADDYITKPFSAREVVLRIKGVIKRVYGDQPKAKIKTFGEVTIDSSKYEVLVNEHAIQLTLTEFKLLTFLSDHMGQVKSRDMLLEQIWESGDGVVSRTIDTHIQRLRNKLGDAGRYIETVRGVGYRFLVE